MKLNKSTIRQFERTQKAQGTEVALHNVVWAIAADLMKSVGVTRIKTS